MIRLGMLASHNGSNMQAVVRAHQRGELDVVPQVVISNNQSSFALEYARQAGLGWAHISGVTHPGSGQEDRAICSTLLSHDVDLVVLVGYLKMLGPKTLTEFKGRILNIHPSLLPKFGGKGMFGRHVHNAVIAAGDKETGITIHHVSDRYDDGEIVAQSRVPVETDDTTDTLAQRVLAEEHSFLVETLRKIAHGELLQLPQRPHL